MINNNFILFNFNAYRATSIGRLIELRCVFEEFGPDIISIQEIHIKNSLICFSDQYHVLVNLESSSKDGIGIVTLVKKKVKIKDVIISDNGRIIGFLAGDIQHWNVYPKSGTNHKNSREKFFNEDLTNLMTLWRLRTKFSFVSGDFNSIHRLDDSRYNSQVHLQPALCQFIKNFSLEDDFVRLNPKINIFSRETKNSATRIDFILSNSKTLCQKVMYHSIQTLDHKAVIGYYDINFSFNREKIPSDKFHNKFVFPRFLEDDSVFLDNAKVIIEKIYSVRDKFKDPTLIWKILKEQVTIWAKARSRTIIDLKNEQFKVLMAEYFLVLEQFKCGIVLECHLFELLSEVNNYYQKEIDLKIRENKLKVIKEQYYDIHKDQRNLKNQNCHFIDKLIVDDIPYYSSENILNAVHAKMSDELQYFGSLGVDDDVTDQEDYFLNLLPKISLSKDEDYNLNKEISLQEVSIILENQVDPDSAPGEDGLTFRFLKIFWHWKSFQVLFLQFLNHAKEHGFGCIENSGTMILINKKGPTFDYNKKRKLTIINKDSNLCGKVWVNRFKNILADKIIPSNQFVCQSQSNIIDELCQIRNINKFLLGSGDSEKNGSILSVDFANAFRSLSLRWLFLVLKRLNLPESFIHWVRLMYQNLGINIVLNKWKSSKILNLRGVMEGHGPSSFLFVVAVIPLILDLQNKLKGINIGDNINHSVKGFMDDLKCFLSEEKEIFVVDSVISNFEKVSGLIVHRDPSKQKCNILCFGSHRKFKFFPKWVNITKKVKIVGALFSNQEDIEMINSKYVESSINSKLYDSNGIRGTLPQKVYFINIFILSKLNYLSQVFTLDKKILNDINRKVLRFLYKGYNERPVQALNFRPCSMNGLGLHHSLTKAKSLLVKSMLREFKLKSLSVVNGRLSGELYGPHEDVIRIVVSNMMDFSAKQLYLEFLNDIIIKGSSLIPSRVERKSHSIKWRNSYYNVSKLKLLTPIEKEFAFLFVNDLLPVGARLHSQKDKTCRRFTFHDIRCNFLENRQHFFSSCLKINDSFTVVKDVIESFLKTKILDKQIFALSFMISDKKRAAFAAWLVVKCFNYIYSFSETCVEKILEFLKNEIDFVLSNIKLGSKKLSCFHELRMEVDMQLQYLKYDL